MSMVVCLRAPLAAVLFIIYINYIIIYIEIEIVIFADDTTLLANRNRSGFRGTKTI